jgi:hypothetical protein
VKPRAFHHLPRRDVRGVYERLYPRKTDLSQRPLADQAYGSCGEMSASYPLDDPVPDAGGEWLWAE